jgi:hypothetical protein
MSGIAPARNTDVKNATNAATKKTTVVPRVRSPMLILMPTFINL